MGKESVVCERCIMRYLAFGECSPTLSNGLKTAIEISGQDSVWFSHSGTLLTSL